MAISTVGRLHTLSLTPTLCSTNELCARAYKGAPGNAALRPLPSRSVREVRIWASAWLDQSGPVETESPYLTRDENPRQHRAG